MVETARPTSPNSQSSAQRALAAIGALRQKDAPGAFSTETLREWLASANGNPVAGLSERSFERLASALEGAGSLERLRSGAYLNRARIPAARLAEAGRFIRSGATLSLQSVLGEAGFLNNPSSMATMALPFGARSASAHGGAVSTSAGSFLFKSLPERFFDPAFFLGAEIFDSRLPFPAFCPEKALCDWLHLGASKHSDLPEPPTDLDFCALDFEKTILIAQAMRVEEPLRRLIARAALDPNATADEPWLSCASGQRLDSLSAPQTKRKGFGR